MSEIGGSLPYTGTDKGTFTTSVIKGTYNFTFGTDQSGNRCVSGSLTDVTINGGTTKYNCNFTSITPQGDSGVCNGSATLNGVPITGFNLNRTRIGSQQQSSGNGTVTYSGTQYSMTANW